MNSEDKPGFETALNNEMSQLIKDKQVQEELLRIKKAIESTSDAIGMSDPEGYHFYQNRAFSEMFEYETAADLQVVGGGRALYNDPAIGDEVFEAIMSGGSWAGEALMISRNGREFPIFLRADAIKDEEGNIVGLIGVHTDITKRKQAEEALKRNEEKLRRLNVDLDRRNRELQSILYTASHDLKAPVVTIRGFIELLREHLAEKLDTKGNNFLDRIDKASNRLQELVTSLVEITYSEQVTAKPVKVSFSTILNAVWSQYQQKFEEAGVEFIHAPEFPEIYVDPSRMAQVLENLFSNALRFSSGKPTSQIRVGWRSDGGQPIFFVEDNGIGIDAEYFDKIFDPFYQVGDIKTDGTGIGLALVKLIIEQHGGSIWVESEKGKRTRFLFTLPPAID